MLGEICQLASLLHDYKQPLDELQALQNRRLRKLIHHAYERVPYYRALFESARIKPQDIQTVQDMVRIPITTKRALRSLPVGDVIASGMDPKDCITRKTGGTTGEPLTIYFSPAEMRRRHLVDFRALLSVGLHPWDRVLILGPQTSRTVRWHERLGLFRTVIVPSTPSVEEQIRRLRDFSPTILWSYANDLDAIVHKLGRGLRSLVNPRVLILSADVTSRQLSQYLQDNSNAELFNFYGAMEVGRIAHECPAHLGWHVNTDRLILECIQDESSPDTNGLGAVVVTPLDGFTMPFIRYRLGDLVKFADRECTCGSFFPLIDALQGREWDLFELPSGRQMSMHWIVHMLRALEGINRYQVIQERRDHVEVRLSFFTGPVEGVLDQLRHRIVERFQEPIQVDIQMTDFVPEPGLKFKTIQTRVEPGENELREV